MQRNQESELAEPNNIPGPEEKISLPFIIINTNCQTIIQCEMTEDRSDVFFNFR